MAAAYPNAWPGWEKQVLAAAGLPDTPQNETFLANWHAAEGSNAKNNPLNTTGYAPLPITVGYSSLNAQGVQNYATTRQGAQATAAFFHMPNFTAILAALRSGDPYSYATKSTQNTRDVAGALAKWGSVSFAQRFAYEGSGGNAPPAAGDTTTEVHWDPAGKRWVTSTTKGPSTPLDWIDSLMSWLEAKGKLMLAYVVIVGVAGALFVVGLKGLGVPVPKAAPVRV